MKDSDRTNKPDPLFPLLIASVLSGASALIFQLVWTRRLSLIFGSTTLAISTVLGIFMGGLAVGSWIFGKLVDRSPERSLHWYSGVEVAIGVFGLLVPIMLAIVSGAYATIAHAFQNSQSLVFVSQAVLCAIVLILPSIFMGATVPLLVRATVHSGGQQGIRVGALYSANTFGAALGVLLCNYYLLVNFGRTGAEVVALCFNLLAALIAALLARRGYSTAPASTAPQDAQTSPAAPLHFAFLVGTAISGFSAMALEVVITRLLALTIGSSVYSYGMVALIFLFGASVGGFVFSMTSKRISPALWFGVSQLCIFAYGLVAVYVVPELPTIFVVGFLSVGGSFLKLTILQMVISGILLFIPAVFFGISFPAVIAETSRSVSVVGNGVGRATLYNTAGTVAGAFLAGFALIPTFGLRPTMLLSFIACGMAGMLAQYAIGRRYLLLTSWTVLLLTATLALTNNWPRELMTSAPSYFIHHYKTPEDLRSITSNSKILFYKDGINSTLSVDRYGQDLIFRMNGKTNASTMAHDLNVRRLIAQIPLALHPNPLDVYMLGLGTGATAAVPLRYRDVKSIDVVEIEASSTEVAMLFNSINNNVLLDPRVKVINADGRNVLAVQDKSYDVIMCDSPDVWVAGIPNLFTVEFYNIVKRRLNEDGIFAQWIHTHALKVEDLHTIVNTIRTVFPEVTLWRLSWSDVLLIAPAQAMKTDVASFVARMETREGIKEDLRAIGIWHPLALFGAFALDKDDLGRMVPPGTPILTDEHPHLEFTAPANLYFANDVAGIDLHLKSYETKWVPDFLSDFTPDQHLDASVANLFGFALGAVERSARSVEMLRISRSRDPGNPKVLTNLAYQLMRLGNDAEAETTLKEARRLDPSDTGAASHLFSLFLKQQRFDDARQLATELVANPATEAEARRMLASLPPQQ